MDSDQRYILIDIQKAYKKNKLPVPKKIRLEDSDKNLKYLIKEGYVAVEHICDDTGVLFLTEKGLFEIGEL